MTVDTHLHLWDLDRINYPWLAEASGPIHRTFKFAEVEPQLEQAGVDRVVLVQAANSIEDSASMFAIAEKNERVAGVVAWVDLLDPAGAAEQLDTWATHPSFVGVRHLIHEEPDADWLVRDAVRASLALLVDRDLAFDVIGVLPRHLENALSLAAELPALRMILDHLGTPPVADVDAEPWCSLMTGLGAHPNVFVKLSGLTTLGESGHAGASDLGRFVDHALDLFGPERVLFGSDWPVSTLAGSYAETWCVADTLVASLSAFERASVFEWAGTAAYRLDRAQVP